MVIPIESASSDIALIFSCIGDCAIGITPIEVCSVIHFSPECYNATDLMENPAMCSCGSDPSYYYNDGVFIESIMYELPCSLL